jgi:hypothetical protein
VSWREEVAGQTALVETGATPTGTVEVSADGSVVVHCDGEPWAGGQAQEVAVSVFSPAALYRISGRATADGARLVFEGDVAVERIQRRRWPRRRLDLAVTLCPVQDWTEPEGVPARTIDISVGGLFVECARPLPDSCDPLVMLHLPDGAEVVANAVTVRSETADDHWRYRLAFRDLDAAGTSRLATLTGAEAVVG